MLIKMEQHQQELELKATTDQHIKSKTGSKYEETARESERQSRGKYPN